MFRLTKLLLVFAAFGLLMGTIEGAIGPNLRLQVAKARWYLKKFGSLAVNPNFPLYKKRCCNEVAKKLRTSNFASEYIG